MALIPFNPIVCELCDDPDPVATPYGPLCKPCASGEYAREQLREHELGNWCDFDGGP